MYHCQLLLIHFVDNNSHFQGIFFLLLQEFWLRIQVSLLCNCMQCYKYMYKTKPVAMDQNVQSFQFFKVFYGHLLLLEEAIFAFVEMCNPLQRCMISTRKQGCCQITSVLPQTIEKYPKIQIKIKTHMLLYSESIYNNKKSTQLVRM